MTKLPKLSPTSYALLGLLAREPRSAYELNATMQTSLIRVFWPRAESHVYSEPKKLLGHGYVSEQGEKQNGRKRTVYTITARGREALEQWLQAEGDLQLRTQAEFMLKLILAEAGPVVNARQTLEEARQSCLQDLRESIAGIENILEHPEYSTGMPWNGITINLMADILIARYQWCQYAQEEAAQVEDDSSENERAVTGCKAYSDALEKMRRVLEESYVADDVPK